MCCQHHAGSGCCCGGHHGGFGGRRFLSKEEKIENLQKYAEGLKKEITEVEKRIAHIKESDKDHHCCS